MSIVPATSTSVVCGSGRFEQRLEVVERARGGVALALGHEQRVGLKDDHDAPRRHHRQRAHGVDERRDAVGELVARRHVAGVDALDVERLEPLLDEADEFGRERRLLDVVFTLKQVDRIGRAALICLRTGAAGNGNRWNHQNSNNT